jgi:MerR family transcriptional regulator, light-induced transcriptional regulator
VSTPGRVRIGELSRRTGVSVDVLRVWERRYGLLVPERSGGGQRLYSEADERRIRAMLEHLASGVSAAEAARIVAADAAGQARVSPEELAAPLASALEALDENAANAALDRIFGGLGADSAIRDVLMPYLHDLGDRWACAQASVADEHFASRLIQGRLLSAARGWDGGSGQRALLACPPGEEHDIGLIAFGIALRQRGWRITYLGANTPIGPVGQMAEALSVDAVVLAATTPPRFADVLEELRELATRVPLALAGAGASPKLVADAGARRLSGDPVAGAAELARDLVRSG